MAITIFRLGLPANSVVAIAAAMSLSSVSVIANALRLRLAKQSRVRKLDIANARCQYPHTRQGSGQGMNKDRFQLKRRSDDLVYTFHRKQLPGGRIGYRREDADLWIRFRPGFGWGIWDDEGALLGRPWNVPSPDQDADHPPEGEWVSKKSSKSYVYELAYA